MSNKLLKKMCQNIDSFTKEELVSQMSSELLESDMFRSILDNLSEGHIVIDKEGRVRFYNQRVYSLVPSSKASGLEEGRTISSVIVDNDMRNFIVDVIDGKERPEPKDFTIGVGNEMRTIRFSFKRIESDEECFVDIVMNDISESIRKETRLRRSESLASMTTMAAGIAHDIKNPLAAMKIHIQLMQKAIQKKGALDEEGAERYLSVIEEEIEHLNSIAVDFLYAVKPMNAELRLSSMNSIIEDLVSFVQPEADRKGIALKIELDRFIPRIELDKKYLHQAFLNIVQNAFAAMEDGGTLSIRSRLHGDYVEIKFSDTGHGIPEEKLSKIFEPYFTTKASGTGLGLTTVYKIMKEHGGDIHVESEEGRGTTFTLAFPVPVSERIAIEEDV